MITYIKKMIEAAEILKAQKAVKPKHPDLGVYLCGYCKGDIDKYWPMFYCPRCGRKIDWK